MLCISYISYIHAVHVVHVAHPGVCRVISAEISLSKRLHYTAPLCRTLSATHFLAGTVAAAAAAAAAEAAELKQN